MNRGEELLPKRSPAVLQENQRKMLQKLDDLKDILESIAEELTALRKGLKTPAKPGVRLKSTGLSFMELLELPDNLRKTLIAVSELGEVTAEEVAEKTGRIRNIESHYLNTLVQMDRLDKKRKGRKVYFTVKYKR